MKKRQFKKKLNFTKVSIFDLSKAKGGQAEGTHYEWCDTGGSNFPCDLTIDNQW